MSNFKIILLAISIFISGISMNSCQKKNSKEINPEFAKYISGFTYGNISPQSYIQIELNQEVPIVQLGEEVDQKLFSFKPVIRGKTIWIDSKTIRFIPEDDELKAGKEYQAKFFLDKLIKVEKEFKTFDFHFKINAQSYSFDLLPYSPLNSNDLNWNTVQGTLNIVNATKLEDINKMIVLKGTNKEAKVKITPLSETSFKINIDSLLRTSNKEKYLLQLNGKEIGAKHNEEHSIEFSAIPEEELSIVDIRVSNEASKSIRITFSSPLDIDQDIHGLVELSMVPNFTYRIDRNVLYIYPETFPKNELKLQLNEGLKNNIGLFLSKDHMFQLKIDDEKPQVKVDKHSNILPNSDKLFLPFSAVNLWAVDVKVIKIYENNILHFLQSGSFTENNTGEIRRFGRLIKKLRIRLDSDNTKDLTTWNNFAIDLAPLIKKDPGAVYMIQLSMKQDYSLYRCGEATPIAPQKDNVRHFSNELITEEDESEWDETQPYYYEQLDWNNYNWNEKDDPCKSSYYMGRERIAETFVISSNIGLIAKSGGNNQLTVATTDILNAKPISGAKITLYNYQMQVIGTSNTDKNGFADIDYSKGRPFLVTAQKGDDKGYLELKEELSLSLSNFDVSGKEVEKGIKGFVYGERGVWRPGDTIHVSFILEDKELKLPPNHPVTLEVYTPTRQFYQKQIKTTHVNGFYTFSIITEPMSPTGVWQSYIKVGGTPFFHPLRIETIKPNRLKVRFDTDSIFETSKEYLNGHLNAQWLHGAPASNLKAKVSISLIKSENPFKNYEDYEFNNPLFNYNNNKQNIFEGNLNASGSINISTKLPKAENAPGMLRGNILSQVYEIGGDMSFYSQTIFYSPYSSYVGVKLPPSSNNEFLETDTPLLFNVVSLNPRGQKISKQNLSYKIYKLKWSWWWNSSEEDLETYINSTSISPIDQGEFSTVNGEAKINTQIDYPDWGRYIILVKDKESGHTTGAVFYVDWPEERGRANKKDPNGLTMLSFSTDKSTYDVGEKATVIIPKSSEGRILISLESGSQILSKEWIKASSNEDTSYSFTITEEMSPNIYVFATLLQTHNQIDNDLPIRMYGVKNIEIKNKDSEILPIIDMPNNIQPEKEFTISISEKEKKPMTYTLAIVDEGLLDLTAFKTPNPWNYFYAREALGVRTWDLFDRVIGKNSGLFGPLISIGGDEALKASSDKVNRFKPIVKFMGPFTIKSNEIKRHKVELPQYVGSVRVMVVAAHEGTYGSSEKMVTVTNPIMTLSTLPRTMGVNEEVWLPINVFAMDESIKNVNISIETKGLLKPRNGSSQTIVFDKEGDQIVYFKLKSGNKTGEEKVRIKASSGSQKFTEDINIGIRNPNPSILIQDKKIIEAKGSADLSISIDEIGEYDWATLELSRMPSISLNKNIDFLLHYPHQCTEQITSQAFPLLYIEELIQIDESEKNQMHEKINNAIKLLGTRQLRDGGFVDWPSNNYSSEWTSTYVGHFLLEAKNKGFDVSNNVLQLWEQFQSKLSRNWNRTSSIRHYYNISMVELQQAYRLYSLALAGEPQLGAMNRMKEIKGLSVQARWRLAAAYAVIGKLDVANELIYNTKDTIDQYSFNNDTYGSSERDMAMIMETYLLLGKPEKALNLSHQVAEKLSSEYSSTQTVAYGLLAMSKLAKEMGKSNIQIDWTLNNNAMNEINTPQSIYRVNIEPRNNINISINNRGEGKIYAQLVGKTQPTTNSIPQVENYQDLQLEVSYTGLDGKPLSPTSLLQGVEFISTATITNRSSQPLTDMALVQIFPSGWEIQNERILDINKLPDINNYNYKDIRDDRVLIYFNLAAGQTKTFKVGLQAAYIGSYYLPPASCQALYNPFIQSITTGSRVEVTNNTK